MKEEYLEMIHPEYRIIRNAHWSTVKKEPFRACLICAVRLKKDENRFCNECTRKYVRNAS